MLDQFVQHWFPMFDDAIERPNLASLYVYHDLPENELDVYDQKANMKLASGLDIGMGR